MDLCDSGISSEAEEETSTHPQTIPIEEVEERFEPETTTEEESLKMKCKKQKKEERVEKLVAAINLKTRWEQPKDWEITYPSSDKSKEGFTDPVNPQNGTIASFEPTNILEDDIKPPDREKGNQSGINDLSVTGSNPNKDCGSAGVLRI